VPTFLGVFPIENFQPKVCMQFSFVRYNNDDNNDNNNNNKIIFVFIYNKYNIYYIL